MSAPDLSRLAPALRSIVQQLFDEGLATAVVDDLRTPDDQARDMAEHVAVAGVAWVVRTYRDSVVKDAIVDELVKLTTPVNAAAAETAILGALAQVVEEHGAAILRELTWHSPDENGLSEAVDLEPVGETACSARARELVHAHVAAGGEPHSEVLVDEDGAAVCHIQAA